MTYLFSTTSSERTVPQTSSVDSSLLPFFLEGSFVVTGVEGGFDTSSSLDEVDISSSAKLRFGGLPAGLSLTGVLALEKELKKNAKGLNYTLSYYQSQSLLLLSLPFLLSLLACLLLSVQRGLLKVSFAFQNFQQLVSAFLALSPTHPNSCSSPDKQFCKCILILIFPAKFT